MKRPKISVIMSVYNTEKYLTEAIESILNQTFNDFEFIIIDDHSTDNSSTIIKKYQNKDKRMKLINNLKNLGITKSLNRGLKIAKGKYIARMDADDISIPKRLQAQYSFLERNKGIFLVGTTTFSIDNKGNHLRRITDVTDLNEIEMKLESGNNFLTHASIMFRNDRQTFYREKFKYSQDYDLYLRLVTQNKKISIINTPLVKYRFLKESISMSKKIQQRAFAKKAIQFYYERKKQGKDSYDLWNNKKIIKNVGRGAEKVYLECFIELYLKTNKRDKLKSLLNQYNLLPEKSFFRYKVYLFFYKVPLGYKIYRKTFYGDNLK